VGQFILNLPSVRLRRTHYRTLFFRMVQKGRDIR
jgi:hypothetical protein